MTERELDGDIAKHVMKVDQVKILDGELVGIYPPTRGWVVIAHYSIDIRSAMEVMTKNHEWADLRYDSEGWTCYLKGPRTAGFTGTEGKGPTAALAICHAALNAVYPPIYPHRL